VSGFTVKAINTPCHSAGSVIYYIESTDLNTGVYEEELIDPIETVAPGHN
jgi:hypothetical protein